MAEIEMDFNNYSNLIMINKIYMSPKGLILGENNNNSSLNPTQGLYLDEKLELKPTHKLLTGYQIGDILYFQGNYYVSTLNSVNGISGIFKIDKDFKSYQQIGKNAPVTVMHIFQGRIFYGGENIGLWSIKPDGTDNKIHLGSDVSGPKISFISSNSKNLYFVTTGPMYYYDGNSGFVYNLLTIVSVQSLLAYDDFLITSNKNKIYKIGLDGKILWEKSFTNNVTYTTRYLDYLFIIERGSLEQRISVSKDKGESIYKSNTSFTPTFTIKNLAFTGDKDIRIFINFYNNGIYQGKFIYDFEDYKFLSIPFRNSGPQDLVDKISSFFDHKYPLLGNLSEPTEAKGKTMNFMGRELPEPYHYYSSHDGIDFAVPMYTPILSAEEGEATYFYNAGGLGHAFVIYHPNGFVTVYGHLDENDLLTKGTTYVSKGQKIGKVGMSGNTSGPHLHFVVYKGSRELQNKVDPFGWQANFTDPWSVYDFSFNGKTLKGSKSFYLWKDSVSYQSKVLSQTTGQEIGNKSFNIAIGQSTSPEPTIITYVPVPPVYDQKNYLYQSNTSFNYQNKDYFNNIVQRKGVIAFKGFNSLEDEKKYSIFKVQNNSPVKVETRFNPQDKTLEIEEDINGDYLVLKDNIKKIKSTSSFATKSSN
jgi:murein DD-endopeptidase MepM/ murein hydrolase activator NlpD